MMEGIKNWIIALMVAAIVGEILLMIAPQGNVSKIVFSLRLLPWEAEVWNKSPLTIKAE